MSQTLQEHEWERCLLKATDYLELARMQLGIAITDIPKNGTTLSMQSKQRFWMPRILKVLDNLKVQHSLLAELIKMENSGTPVHVESAGK